MTRVLTIQRTVTPRSERARYMERLLVKKAYYERARCRFWVFEEVSLPGAFLEFVEAADAQTLADANAAAPEPLVDRGRIYREVELT